MKKTGMTLGVLIVLAVLVVLFSAIFAPNNAPITNQTGGNTAGVNSKLPAGSTPPGDSEFIIGTFGWREGMLADRTPIELQKAKSFSVTFSMDGKISGTTDCNSFGGAYQIGSDGIITFGPLMSTKMYCDGSQEGEFLELLSKVNHYQVITELNVLILESDQAMMVFGKQK